MLGCLTAVGLGLKLLVFRNELYHLGVSTEAGIGLRPQGKDLS